MGTNCEVEIVSILPTDSAATAVAVGQNRDRLFIGADGALLVADITNPASPRWVGGCSLPPGTIKDIGIGDTIVYLAGDNGLQMVDVSHPSHPRALGFYSAIPDAWGVVMWNPYVYVASRQGWLSVLEVPNPSSPQEKGRVKLPCPIADVARYGNTIWAATTGRGIAIVHPSDDGRNWRMDPYRPGGETDITGVMTKNLWVYATTRDGRLAKIDPSRLVLVHRCDGLGRPVGVAGSGEVICVAANQNDLWVIRDRPFGLEIAGHHKMPGEIWQVAASDDRHVMVACGREGVAVLQVRF
ncbi:MAG: LVIVD repeat-containing protein [Anaerolineae bacterium]